MPAQAFDALFRALAKGELAPVYYLHGPEDILKDEAVRAILDRALDPAFRDFNLDQRSAGQLDPDALFALCTTLPMMAERRVVVLRDLEGLKRKPKLRAALLQYLGRPAPETVLVLVQGAGDDEDKEIARSPRSRFPPSGSGNGSSAGPPPWAWRWKTTRPGTCWRQSAASWPRWRRSWRSSRPSPRAPRSRRPRWASWSGCATEKRSSTGATR
jgi:hypothetical protein